MGEVYHCGMIIFKAPAFGPSGKGYDVVFFSAAAAFRSGKDRLELIRWLDVGKPGELDR